MSFHAATHLQLRSGHFPRQDTVYGLPMATGATIAACHTGRPVAGTASAGSPVLMALLETARFGFSRWPADGEVFTVAISDQTGVVSGVICSIRAGAAGWADRHLKGIRNGHLPVTVASTGAGRFSSAFGVLIRPPWVDPVSMLRGERHGKDRPFNRADFREAG